jgi:hypothetical protein
MHAKDFVVNDGRQTKIVEDLCAILPHVDTAIFLQTLVVKPIYLCDLTTLMVASNQCDAIGISHLFASRS